MLAGSSPGTVQRDGLPISGVYKSPDAWAIPATRAWSCSGEVTMKVWTHGAQGSIVIQRDFDGRGDEMEKLLLREDEAREVLGVSRTVLFGLMRRGEAGGGIESVRIGRSRRIPAVALAAYVERLTTEAHGVGR